MPIHGAGDGGTVPGPGDAPRAPLRLLAGGRATGGAGSDVGPKGERETPNGRSVEKPLLLLRDRPPAGDLAQGDPDRKRVVVPDLHDLAVPVHDELDGDDVREGAVLEEQNAGARDGEVHAAIVGRDCPWCKRLLSGRRPERQGEALTSGICDPCAAGYRAELSKGGRRDG